MLCLQGGFVGLLEVYLASLNVRFYETDGPAQTAPCHPAPPWLGTQAKIMEAQPPYENCSAEQKIVSVKMSLLDV